MLNHSPSLAAGASYDKRYKEAPDHQGAGLAEFLQGSMFNPLRTMCRFTLVHDAEELAEVTGIPAHLFDDKYLDAPADEVITALGKLALIFLSSFRNKSLPHETLKEDSLHAEAAFREMLAMRNEVVIYPRFS